MDGGGRLLGSVGAAGAVLVADGYGRGLPFPSFSLFKRKRSEPVSERASIQSRHRRSATSVLSRHWPAMALVFGVIGGAGLYGARVGGEYDTFVAHYGTPADIVARLAGFEIDTITITGLDQLNQGEVLDASGVSERNSLLLLNAGDVRSRLKAVPLVRDVAVRKLFPNSLVFDVTERKAAALWQKDGQISVVAADGVAIDAVRDSRFNTLPFIVGPGANGHLKEFNDLVASAGGLRDRIKAGIYVGERRWTLQMDTGLEVMLPEIKPDVALAGLAELDRTTRILDKDVLSLDLRIPGRITARLSEDAAAARAEMLAKKPKKVAKE